MDTFEIPISELPRSVIADVQEKLIHFSIGFVTWDGDDLEEAKDVGQAGSGVLIKVGARHAILTADHVADVVRKRKRIGVALSKDTSATTLDVSGFNIITVGRGPSPSEGPDLALICLAPTQAAALAAKKSFADLDGRKARAMGELPPTDHGIWVLEGFVAELTGHLTNQDGVAVVKNFGLMAGLLRGADERVLPDGKFDVWETPVDHYIGTNIPSDFGGVSGGGLWHVTLRRNADDENWTVGFPVLLGIAFYQEFADENGRGLLRCNGRRSIYDLAIAAIANESSAR